MAACASRFWAAASRFAAATSEGRSRPGSGSARAGAAAATAVHTTAIATRARTAEQVFELLGLTNVGIRVGDGTEGLWEEAPFDRILVTAGAPSIPESLKAQLADKGRLVLPVGPSGYQHLTVIDRFGNSFEQQEREACVFVPLIGRHGWQP